MARLSTVNPPIHAMIRDVGMHLARSWTNGNHAQVIEHLDSLDKAEACRVVAVMMTWLGERERKAFPKALEQMHAAAMSKAFPDLLEIAIVANAAR